MSTDEDTNDVDEALQSVNPDGGSESAATDAGTEDLPFEVLSEYSETRWDRIGKIYDAYVHAPFAIVRHDPRAIFGFTVLSIYILGAIFAPLITDPVRTGSGGAFVAPFQTLEHPFGTDNFGRDLFDQTVLSIRPVLEMMVAGAVFTAGMGLIIGSIAGYKGGWVDTVLSSITDVFINIPGLPFVMVLAVLLEDFLVGRFWLIGIVLSAAAWSGLARAIRSQMLTLRRESFTEASRAIGMPTRSILLRDLIPHLMPYVMINLTNAARQVIFAAVALYYLGLLPYTTENWGITLNLAYQSNAFYRTEALHWFIIPMVAIALISMAMILLGQSLDRVFNPRVRARHEKRVKVDDADSEAKSEDNSTFDNTGGL